MKLKKNEILVLRTCKSDGTSYNGFQWPDKGYVEAPDYEDTDQCGHGLHGLPWAAGNVAYLTWYGNNGWIVKVDTSSDYQHGTGDMSDKCKFKSGYVVLSHASREDCITLIMEHAPKDICINYSTQKAGDKSTQTAGDNSTQTAGYNSTQKAGNNSTQTAGNNSTQKAGDDSTQTAGNNSTQTAGDKSTQKAGDDSTQKAGDDSTQTAGYNSTQKAGDKSTQTAGYNSTQKAGINSVQIIRYYTSTLKVKTRIVTPSNADKWYKFENENWRECTAEEIERAEKEGL